MNWASRRQTRYFLAFLTIILLIIFALTYKLIFKQPTCNDGKQNGTETGVDCGGSCMLQCTNDIYDPVILWSRAFHVVGNDYNLVAYIENRNKTSGVIKANYEFRVYDSENKLLGRKLGSTFVPPNQQFAIFEPRFDAGENEVRTVTFSFLPPIIWVKKAPTLQSLPIVAKDISFDNNKDTPTLSATIANDSIYNVPEFDVIAILYDFDHNAINASASHKSGMSSNTSIPVTFTWPEAMPTVPVTQDVLISINPFSVTY